MLAVIIGRRRGRRIRGDYGPGSVADAVQEADRSDYDRRVSLPEGGEWAPN